MKSAPYSTINDEIARRIKALHREHPRLGHEGFMRILDQEGLAVDEAELKRYLRANKIRPESPGWWSWGNVARFRWWPFAFHGTVDSGDVGDTGGNGE